MGNCRQDFFIASLYLNTPAKIVPSQVVYTRFGAIDLLAPPAGKVYFVLRSLHISYTQFTFFRIGILGFLTYKRAMSELSFQEVYITDPLHVYITYIYTLCVYIAGYFLPFLWIFTIFYDFYRFYWIFLVFFLVFLVGFYSAFT